jgi:hypothetical protein
MKCKLPKGMFYETIRQPIRFRHSFNGDGFLAWHIATPAIMAAATAIGLPMLR